MVNRGRRPGVAPRSIASVGTFLDAVRDRVDRLRRRHRAPISRPRPVDRRLRRPAVRGLPGDPQRHPARRHPRPARVLLRRRLRCRRDQQFGAFSTVLAEYEIPERAYELSHASARARPRGRRRLRRPTASCAGSSARARRWPTLGLDHLRRPARRLRGRPRAACSTAASTCSLIETVQDLLQAKAAMIGARRAMAAAGRVVPIAGAGHHRDHRPHAARHRDRRRARRARRDAARRVRPQLRRPARRRCTSTCATCRSTRRSRSLRAQRRPAVDRRRPHALRPHARAARRRPRPQRHASSASPSSAAAAARRRSTSAPSSSACATSRRCAAQPDHRAERVVAVLAGAVRPGDRATSSSASAPTPTARRRSATRCSTRTGTRARPSPASRSARAATPSTCASTTSAATARPTWTSSPRRFAERIDAVDRARLDRARRHPGRPRAPRRPRHHQLGQPRGRRRREHPLRQGAHAGRRVRRRGRVHAASTKRARPARRSGSCAPRSRSATSPSSATACATRTCCSTRWRCTIGTGLEESRGDGVADHRRHPPDLAGAAELLHRRSGCRTSRSVSNPALRHVINSVFLHECVEAGLDERHRPRRASAAAQPHRRRRQAARPRPHLRPPPRRLRPAARSCSTSSRA